MVINVWTGIACYRKEYVILSTITNAYLRICKNKLNYILIFAVIRHLKPVTHV